MNRQLRKGGLVVGVLIVVLAGGLAATKSAHLLFASPAAPPQTATETQPPVLMVPVFLPDPGISLAPSDGAAIAAPSDYPVAQLSQPPSSLGEVATRFNSSPDAQWADPHAGTFGSSAVVLRVLSQVRYQGAGETVYVNTVRPSPAALKLGLDLGREQQFMLPDGTMAHGSSVTTGDDATNASYTAQWMDQGYIVQVSVDGAGASEASVESLADSVVLRR